MTSSENWDDYLTTGAVESYQDGDVAEVWNAHADQSDAGLDAADAAIESNDAALYDAAGHLGTDPTAVDAALGQATESFEATYDHQLESMGLDPHATG